MTYRFLEQDELDKLDDVFDKYGWTKLHPIYSRVVVAEEDGEIVGFLCVQSFLRAEPLWVDKTYRGTEVAGELATRVKDFLLKNNVNWISICDSPFSEKYCQENDMVKIEVPVYRSKMFHER